MALAAELNDAGLVRPAFASQGRNFTNTQPK